MSDVGRDWQPIETAPKDRYVLLFGRQQPHDMLRVEGDIIFAGYWSVLDEVWCCMASLWNGPFYEPTHWMPLPAPPVEAAATQANEQGG